MSKKENLMSSYTYWRGLMYIKKVTGILLACMILLGAVVIIGAMGEDSDGVTVARTGWIVWDGDQYINNTTSEDSIIIVLNGNLTITDGHSLTFNNVRLIVNCMYDGQYNITVKPGGRLCIGGDVGGSESALRTYKTNVGDEKDIPANIEKNSHRFTFSVEKDSYLSMTDTKLYKCGYDDKNPGLVIKTDYAFITRCEFYDNWQAITFDSSHHHTIESNIIGSISRTNHGGMRFISSSNNIIKDCEISSNDNEGIIFESSSNNNFVSKCNFNENAFSIRIHDSKNISIKDCVLENSGYGIELVNSLDNDITKCNVLTNIHGIHFDSSSNNRVDDNCIISGNDFGVAFWDSMYNTLNNTELFNNNFSISFHNAPGNVVTNCSIFENSYGIFFFTESSEIRYNNISNNDYYGIRNIDSDVDIDAAYNYWGSEDGPSGSGPGGGDNVSDNVIFVPYLTKYPYEKPEVSINLPVENALLTGNVTIEGLSNTYVSDGVHWVDVSIDDTTFTEQTLTVNNVTSWSSFWNSTLYPNGTNCPDGTHTIYARAFDGVDYSEIVSVNITTDNTLPTSPGKPLHEDEVPTGYDNDILLDFSWGNSFDENFDRYEVYVSVNGEPFMYDHNVTENFTTISGEDGNIYSVKVVAVDKAGLMNESEVSDSITCDMTPPSVTITDLSQIINITSFTLHWTTADTDICYYEVKLNEGIWVNVGLNTSYEFKNLSDGDNPLYVRGIDNANNSGIPGSVVITVDRAAPAVMAIEYSHALINEASDGESFYLNITYSENMNTSISPTIDLVLPTLTGTLSFLSGSWDGATIYRAQYTISDDNVEQDDIDINVTNAQDVAGNTQTVYTEPDAFDVDTDASIVTSVVCSHTLINEATVGEVFYLNITYGENMDASMNPVISFTPELNGTLTWLYGVWDNSTYRAEYTIADINEEQANVNISINDALDVAGNTQTAYTEPDAFDVDTSAPIVTITTVTQLINATFFTINWTIGVNVTDISYYEVRLNDGNWTDIGSNTSHRFTDLSEEDNTLYVRGVDLSNNTYTTSITITVDTMGPTIIIYEESTSINRTSFTITWYSTDAWYYEVKDNNIWVYVGVNTSYEFKNLSDGNNTLYVRGTDYMNNTAVVFIVITVDRVAPVVTITSISQTIKVTYFVMNWTGPDIEYCNVSKDGENWTYADSNTGHNFSLTEGENRLYVYAVDLAGNVGESENIVVTVDTTPPAVAVSDHIINTKSFTLHWNTTDTDIKYYEVSNDGVNWTTVTNNSYLFTNLSDGNNTLYVKAVDNAGNVGETIPVNVSVDMTKPVLVIPEQNVKTDKNSFTVSWSSNDTDIQYYEVSYDNNIWFPLNKNATTYIFTNLSEGENTLYVRAVDSANNTNTVIITVTVKIPSPPEEVNWMLYIIIIVIPVVVIVVIIVLRKKGILKRKEKTEEEEKPKEEEEKKGFLKRKKTEKEEKEKRGFLKRKKTEGIEKPEMEEAVPEKTEIPSEELAPVKMAEKPEGAPDCFGTYDDSEACKKCSLSEECKKATG
jgi:parallel beta-helix repeat protein